MPEEIQGPGSIVGVVRVWAEAEVQHGPNWIEPEKSEEKK